MRWDIDGTTQNFTNHHKFMMDAAFDRLTDIQKENINHDMFIFAYNCIAKSKGNIDTLKHIIDEETLSCPHLRNDLARYCKLVGNVM